MSSWFPLEEISNGKDISSGRQKLFPILCVCFSLSRTQVVSRGRGKGKPQPWGLQPTTNLFPASADQSLWSNNYSRKCR